MPKGRKKTILPTENQNFETSAEISAPVDVKEQQKKETVTTPDKPKNKAGRKPKANSSKANKTAAAQKTEKSTKTAVSSDNEKTKSKAGRKPKAEKAKASTGNEKKTPAKSVKKPVGKKKSAAPVPAPADNAAATTEKKKRAYNKKAKTAKTEDIIIQSVGGEYAMSDITDMCKNDYRGGSRKQIKSIKVYLKAENNGIRAYYVVNDTVSGHIDL